MKKIIGLIFIISVFCVFGFLHHEQSVAMAKKESIDHINSRLSNLYKDFDNNLLSTHSHLVKMQFFFESDPNMIPEIYNEYYSLLDRIANEVIELEKKGLKIKKVCDKLENYYNKICFVYIDNTLELKSNNQVVIKKFNDVILKYNDMSLSDYEIFRL